MTARAQPFDPALMEREVLDAAADLLASADRPDPHVILRQAALATLPRWFGRGRAPEAALAIGAAYERLLRSRPVISGEGGLQLEAVRDSARRVSGAFYTPPALVEYILDACLEPLIDERIATEGDVATAVLGVRICDPAAGVGHFLVASARRLARRLEGTGMPRDRALHDVIVRCVHGVDLDPVALAICRAILASCAGVDERDAALLAHLRHGNALLGARPSDIERGIPDAALRRLPGDDVAACRVARERHRRGRAEAETGGRTTASDRETARLAADAWCAAFLLPIQDADDAVTQVTLNDIRRGRLSAASDLMARITREMAAHHPLHWHLDFADVFERERPGFDVIVGNPPFLNQLETATAMAQRHAALLRARFGEAVSAYTDTASLFLALAVEFTREGGHVMLVQPQSLLATRDSAGVRRAVLERASLAELWISNERVFEDASVYTCAPLLRVGGARRAMLRRTCTGRFTPLATADVDMDELRGRETWAHLAAAASGIPDVSLPPTAVIGDIATATADFRDQYYGLRGFLLDDAERDDDAYPPIVTAGLIDLATCRWGNVGTRILKQGWRWPRIDRDRMEAEGELGAWIRERRTPKIILATQTRVMEVFVDAAGRYVPGLPLITISAPSVEDLWRIGAALASPVCTAIARTRYAGTALHAEAIKLSAKQTLTLPLPVRRQAWEGGARALRAAHEAPDEVERARRLVEMGRLMGEAYGLKPAEAERLTHWWQDRDPQLTRIGR